MNGILYFQRRHFSSLNTFQCIPFWSRCFLQQINKWRAIVHTTTNGSIDWMQICFSTQTENNSFLNKEFIMVFFGEEKEHGRLGRPYSGSKVSVQGPLRYEGRWGFPTEPLSRAWPTACSQECKRASASFNRACLIKHLRNDWWNRRHAYGATGFERCAWGFETVATDTAVHALYSAPDKIIIAGEENRLDM